MAETVLPNMPAPNYAARNGIPASGSSATWSDVNPPMTQAERYAQSFGGQVISTADGYVAMANVLVDPSGRTDGIYQGNGTWTYPVSLRDAIEVWDLPLSPPGPPLNPQGPAALDLAARFGKGVVHGALDMVWQPVANVIDIGQVAVGLASGGRYEPTYLSGTGQNYQAGMSYGETVTRAVLGSNPVTGVGLASYDLTSNGMRGDWGGVAEGAGGLVGGFAVGKYGQRAFAPEPGAQLGLYRVAPEVEVSAPASAAGSLPPLPANQAPSFTSAVPADVSGMVLNRVFGGNAPINGGYWTDRPIPTTEGGWRSDYAAPRWFGNTGEQVGAWTAPEGQMAWGGKAAPQDIKGFSDKFTVFGTTYRYGWIQPGGGYQFFLPDAYNVIPSSSVVSGATPWKK